MTLYRCRAMLKIAEHWGRPVECMSDLKPVKSGRCKGKLEIDHIFSGYSRDAGYRLYKDIVQDKRHLDYFRILCRRHNASRKGGEGFVES